MGAERRELPACSRRGVLRDSDRLATCCIQALSLEFQGERLWIGGPSPQRHQFLHGIHDPILRRPPRTDMAGMAFALPEAASSFNLRAAAMSGNPPKKKKKKKKKN